jgi:uncharacterized protein YutE (UPF0331/DUF86 family)
MVNAARALPVESLAAFRSDPRNVAAADSYLRRALEALLDLGRHILAKGFGRAVVEYKEIAKSLVEVRVLDERQAGLLRQLAGYRNRLVHFYHEIGEEKLYEICSKQLGDIEAALATLLAWIEGHPEKIDRTL